MSMDFDEVMIYEDDTTPVRERPFLPAIRLYIRDANRYPLLSAAEEQRLAERITQGDNEALQWLINCNLRLVINIAKRYVSENNSLLDLVQDGNIGLMKAARKYQPDKGARFSTYATYWIRQAISRTVSEDSTCIPIPEHTAELMNKVMRTLPNLPGDPDNKQLAQACGMPLEQVVELRRLAQAPLSLEAPCETGKHGVPVTIAERLEDTASNLPAVQAERSDKTRSINEALSVLPPKYRQVIEMIYGINCRPYKRSEVSKLLNISQERIRQIHNKALALLKEPLANRLKEPA